MKVSWNEAFSSADMSAAGYSFRPMMITIPSPAYTVYSSPYMALYTSSIQLLPTEQPLHTSPFSSMHWIGLHWLFLQSLCSYHGPKSNNESNTLSVDSLSFYFGLWHIRSWLMLLEWRWIHSHTWLWYRKILHHLLHLPQWSKRLFWAVCRSIM